MPIWTTSLSGDLGNCHWLLPPEQREQPPVKEGGMGGRG